jgi:hypothetical protein
VTVQTAQDEQFTFISGLNTEAGYFTFPKNTWSDGDNVLPNVSGLISKRNAVDLETSYELSTQNIASSDKNLWAFTTGKWLAVAGQGDTNFIVAQCGRYIFFYTDTSISTSGNKKSFSIDLNTYKASGNPSIIGTTPIKCVSASGRLIITSGDTYPILVEYDTATDTISTTTITVEIRDFQGLDDGLDVDERPLTLSDTHKYNLYNQGWPQANIDAYFAAKAKYPSNAQSWIYGKDTSDNFDSSVLDKQDFGTSPAPRGKYVLNAFYEDRATASGIGGIAVVSENYRPTVCTFFAGRAWYAGVRSNRVGSTVYFSQVALSEDKYGKCYQDADPTSEVISDLVDSDGGAISIQDCGQIVDIMEGEGGVIILATNGVWQILGTSQNGFTATGYEVKKLSSFGCVGRQSVVDVEDSVLFWSYSAICQISRDQVGSVVVKSLTDLNIRSLYTEIPSVAKQFASGAYNGTDKTVYWLYKEDLTDASTAFPYHKTHALGFDVRLGAFYTLSFSTLTTIPAIVDVVVTKETADQTVEFTVIDSSGNTVIDASSNIVTASLTFPFASEQQFKFFTVVPDSTVFEVSFADFLNERNAPTKWYDWYAFNSVGVAYDSYILTGYAFAPNGPSKKKQGLYITVFMERTETGFDVSYNDLNSSSCLLQTRWDFTDSSNANKWSTEQEVYRHTRMFIPSTTAFDDGYPVVITKNKVRGRGRAVQLKFTADADYDMRILGWSVPYYGGTNV